MAVFRQAAVIAYRMRAGEVQIALVTSARGKRWVLPKGSVERGESVRQAAARETEEEAGLRGELEPDPVGRYRYSKERGDCRVAVFAMLVTEVLERWPERHLRRRRWFAPGQAERLLPRAARDSVRAFTRAVRC